MELLQKVLRYDGARVPADGAFVYRLEYPRRDLCRARQERYDDIANLGVMFLPLSPKASAASPKNTCQLLHGAHLTSSFHHQQVFSEKIQLASQAVRFNLMQIATPGWCFCKRWAGFTF